MQVRWKFVRDNQGDGMRAKSKRLLLKDESFGHNVVNVLRFWTTTTIYYAASKKFPTHIILLSNVCMTCIFSKELVVTSRGICLGGGNRYSGTKNNYEGPSRQNVYPILCYHVLPIFVPRRSYKINCSSKRFCVSPIILDLSCLAVTSP